MVLAFVTLFAAGAHSRELRLPIPPIPPKTPPLMAAPVPDPDFIGPNNEPRNSAVTIDAGINHRAAPSPGLGYAPGARYQIDNDRRMFVLPGLMLHVPLP
jgi:hypothetical protein